MRTIGALVWEEVRSSLSYIHDPSTHQEDNRSTKMTRQNLQVLTGNASNIGHGYTVPWENEIKGMLD